MSEFNVMDYRKVWECGRQFEMATDGLERLISFLMNSQEPRTPREIGQAIWGEGYFYSVTHRGKPAPRVNKSQSSHLGMMLRKMVKAGYIKRVKIAGKPVEVTRDVGRYTYDEEPRRIKVTDERGRTFEIDNPHWSFDGYWRSYTTETVKATYTPHHNAYMWNFERD